MYTVTPARQKPEGQNAFLRSCQPDLAPGDRRRTRSVTGRGQAGSPSWDGCGEYGSGDAGREKRLELPARRSMTGPALVRKPVRQGAIKTATQTQAHNWPAANFIDREQASLA